MTKPLPVVERDALIEHMQEGFLVLDADDCIVEMNIPAERYTGCVRAEALGKRYEDLFPRAAASGAIEAFADVRVTGRSTRISGYSSQFPDRFVDARIFQYGREIGIVFGDLTERRREQQELRDHQARMAAIFEQAAVGLVKITLHGTINFANAAFLELAGRVDRTLVLGHSFEEFVGTEDLRQVRDRLGVASTSGDAVSFEMAMRRPNAQPVPVSIGASAMKDEHGNLIGYSLAVSDVSHRMSHEEHRRQLDRELDHRMRNLVSLVQNVARRTAATSISLPEFLAAFDGRVLALAAAQDLIVDQHGDDVPLPALVGSVLQHQPDEARDSVSVGLPDILVPEGVATAIGMMVHELASNALKWGALTVPGGRVSLRGELQGSGPATRMALTWSETGGPPTATPTTIGFGLRMITSAFATFEGSVTLAWPPDGLICVCSVPILPTVALEQLDNPSHSPALLAS